MASKGKNVSLWIDPKVIAALDAVAEQDDRSRNWEIVQAIKAWIAARARENGKEEEVKG